MTVYDTKEQPYLDYIRLSNGALIRAADVCAVIPKPEGAYEVALVNGAHLTVGDFASPQDLMAKGGHRWALVGNEPKLEDYSKLALMPLNLFIEHLVSRTYDSFAYLNSPAVQRSPS